MIQILIWLVILYVDLGFGIEMICFMMRQVNLSIAIIPMSHQFGWNSLVAGLVQSSFFWGYALSQLPGGWLAKIFGGRLVINYSNSFFLDECRLITLIVYYINQSCDQAVSCITFS